MARSDNDLEQRIKERIEKIAPPGTPLTPELKTQLIDDLTEFLKDELVARNVPRAFVDVIVSAALAKKVCK